MSGYVFHEFPKWVQTPDGRDVIVQNAEEEQAVIAPQDEPKRRGRPPGSKNRPKVDDDNGA